MAAEDPPAPPLPPPHPAALDILSRAPEAELIEHPDLVAAGPTARPLLARSTDETAVMLREKVGWFAAAFALEPFSSSGVALFCSVLVESLASEAGFVTGNPSQPCDTSVSGYNCSVYLGSWEVNTSSLVLYTTALSVLLQAFAFISLGPFGDYGSIRKLFLLLFGFIGAAFVMLFFGTQTPNMWPMAVIALLFGNLFLGLSSIFVNGFLPVLTTYIPEVIAAASDEKGNMADFFTTAERASSTLSTHGVASAAVGDLLGTGVSVGVILAAGANTASLALGCGVLGAWWFAFLFVTVFLLKPRPGPPFPKDESWLSFFFLGWKRLYRTLRHALELRDLLIFLAVWFMISDAISAIASSAVLFAKSNLHLSDEQLIVVALMLPVAAFIGLYVSLFIQRRFRIRAKVMIMALLSLYLILPIWGLAGLHTTGEFFALTAIYGILYAPLMNYSRVIFAQMIPAGLEAELFSLFAVTDKGSSFFAPVIVGAITNATGNIRNGFWFLLGVMIVAVVIAIFVDERRGRARAVEFHLQRGKEVMMTSWPASGAGMELPVGGLDGGVNANAGADSAVEVLDKVDSGGKITDEVQSKAETVVADGQATS